MAEAATPNWPDDQTHELRALKHRQRLLRRAQKQAGRRRALRRNWPTRQGPPAPGYIDRSWRPAEERYLHRYGWPLPDNRHAKSRPQIPKLNTGGDHRRPLAMRIARRIMNSTQQLPNNYRQNRMQKALALELEACQSAPPERQPLLMRSAAHMAAAAGWPAQARVIQRQAEMRFPNIAGKLDWPTPEAMNYHEGVNISREDAAIAAALRSIATGASPGAVAQATTPRLAPAAAAMLEGQKFAARGETM